MKQPADIRGYDFHCHVDLHLDPTNLIKKCDAHRIVVLGVTTTPRAWSQNQTWTEHSNFVYSAIGLHPELVNEFYEEISLVEAIMDETRLIGEIGLDGSPKYRKSFKLQHEVFSRVLKRAFDLGGCVLSIHSRRSADQVVDMISHGARTGRVLPILHWYSGSKTTANRALEHGCYFSVNLRMLYTETGRALITILPTNRLLVETDSPFAFKNSQEYDATHPVKVAELVADLKRIPREEFKVLLRKNANKVFDFAGIKL